MCISPAAATTDECLAGAVLDVSFGDTKLEFYPRWFISVLLLCFKLSYVGMSTVEVDPSILGCVLLFSSFRRVFARSTKCYEARLVGEIIL